MPATTRTTAAISPSRTAGDRLALLGDRLPLALGRVRGLRLLRLLCHVDYLLQFMGFGTWNSSILWMRLIDKAIRLNYHASGLIANGDPVPEESFLMSAATMTGLGLVVAAPPSRRLTASALVLPILAVILALAPLSWATAGVVVAALGISMLIQPATGLLLIAATIPWGGTRAASDWGRRRCRPACRNGDHRVASSWGGSAANQR